MRMVNIQLLEIDAAALFREQQRQATAAIEVGLRDKARNEHDRGMLDIALRSCTICQSIMRAMNRDLSRKTLIAAMHVQKTFF